MYEVELKVRADHESVQDQLAATGWEQEQTRIQEDTYYDAPHREFADTDEALRLRRERLADAETWTTKITYKGPLVEAESKTREEFETMVEDGDTAGAIFDRLGFTPAATVRKHREQYHQGDYHLTLDRVDELGEFVEIETETTAENIEAARDEAITRLQALGLDPEAQIRTSYLGLLLAETAPTEQDT